MTIDNYLIYLLVATGYIASPGPAVFIAINGGATAGVKSTAATLLGNTAGLGVLAFISALGLGAFVLGSARLTAMVTAGGAVWIFYLGAKMCLAGAPDPGGIATTPRDGKPLTGFTDGLVLALTNPKPIIFFVSIYPQFIVVGGGQSQIRQFMLLGATFLGLSFVLLNGYSFLSSLTIGKVLSVRGARWFNGVFGMIFIALALYLLAPFITSAAAQPH